MAFYGVQLGKSTHQIIIFKPKSNASDTRHFPWNLKALSVLFAAVANVF